MNLSVIDWRITSKCNNNCNYCYGNKGIETPDNIDKIITSIHESGCRAVCISGGEPLLEDKVFLIISKLHELGISIYLSTNGTNYLKNRSKIEPYISKLSLPLDGYDSQTNSINGRSEESFDTVKEILDYYKINKPTFKIKVGTVLTKENMFQEHFERMFNFLSDYPINKWKIFELIPEGNGETLYKKSGYSEEEYSSFQQRIQKYIDSTNTAYGFALDFSRRKSRDRAYFIILPSGDAMIPIDKGDCVIEEKLGNMLNDDVNNIVSNWQSQCNVMNCIANFEKRTIPKPIIAKLNDLDRKILYELDKDPLELERHLEDALSLSREEIDKRIDYLYNIRAIDHIMPLINISKFGFNLYLCNLYFKNEIKEQVNYIADVLCKNDNIAWVAECYDWMVENDSIIFRIAIFAENNAIMYDTITNINNIFRESLYNWEVDNVPDKRIYGQRYILNRSDEKINELFEESHLYLYSEGIYKITKNEYNFFRFSKSEEKYTLDNIANSTNMTKSKLTKVIKKLMSDNIIQKFQAVYNPEILGYRWYKFFIRFKDMAYKKEFEDIIKNYICVTHINTLTSGTWNMDFEIQVKTPNEAFTFWEKVKNIFGNKISDERVIRIKKEYKFDFLTQAIIEAMKKQLY